MDREDRHRFFIVGSVFYEIVAPIFRRRIQKNYTDKGFGSLQDFINSEPVIHILFHLRYRNAWCCLDKQNCIQHLSLPLHYNDWKRLFTQNPNPRCGRFCRCKFTANSVLPDDLDITLAGLILKECCSLGAAEGKAFDVLKEFKNNYLSHNTDGYIILDEFNMIWADLTSNILQLDRSKEDDLVRIQNRPFDENLCNKYHTELLAVHKKLDEMDAKLDVSHQYLKGIQQDIQHVLRSVGCKYCRGGFPDNDQRESEVLVKQYTLGQNIFYKHHQFHISHDTAVIGIVMTDDGKIVTSVFPGEVLMIHNTEGTTLGSIQLENQPWGVTAVNNSTVAVTLPDKHCIQLCDINNYNILSTIPVPGECGGITTINNKLAVGGCHMIWIIDHVTEQVIRTIQTDDQKVHFRLHAYKDRLYSCDRNNCIVSRYTHSGDTVFSRTIQHKPSGITCLEDGSLYVISTGGIIHMSADGKHYKPVTGKFTSGIEHIWNFSPITFNNIHRKLIIGNFSDVELYNVNNRNILQSVNNRNLLQSVNNRNLSQSVNNRNLLQSVNNRNLLQRLICLFTSR